MSTITQRRLDAVRSDYCRLKSQLDTTIKTQAIQIKKQKLAIEILTKIVDELRQPYNNSERFHDLYLMATDGLNELERLEVIQ